MSDAPRYRRPAMPGAGRFESTPGAADPASRSEAADRCANLLVRGAWDAADETVVERVVSLADAEGLDTLAELWAGSPADSVAGCLWRLYLLRTWVYADPAGAAGEFEAGRHAAPVQEAVAGVVDPPGPDEVRQLADTVLRGVVVGDFADTLFRAAAFARVAASGRARIGSAAASTPYESDLSAARLVAMADQLERCGRMEIAGELA